MSVRVKWRGSEFEFSDFSNTIHDAVSERFKIPAHRLKLIYRGKQYTPGESADLIEQSSVSGLPVMVVGTPAVDQLDSMQNSLRNSKSWIFHVLADMPRLIFVAIRSVLHFVWIFIQSLFIPEARGEQPHAAPGQ